MLIEKILQNVSFLLECSFKTPINVKVLIKLIPLLPIAELLKLLISLCGI